MISEEQMLEYEKAQDSAEHYNTMVWTLISLILAFSLLIIKTILLDINSSGWTFHLIGKWTIISGILLIGTLSWMYFGYLIEGANQKKKWKYIICQEIEKRNKKFLGQNLGTKYLPFTQNEWGLKLFIGIKISFIIFFTILSYLVTYKSLYTEELIWTSLIFSIHITIFCGEIIFEYNYKKRQKRQEEILSKVKEEQKKYSK
ncbi:MAG: hypothetical protein AABX83_04235 [Nanoarchaeota archaeon]